MEENQTLCLYNCGVFCEGGECGKCGWNPEVSNQRVTQWILDRRREEASNGV